MKNEINLFLITFSEVTIEEYCLHAETTTEKKNIVKRVENSDYGIGKLGDFIRELEDRNNVIDIEVKLLK